MKTHKNLVGYLTVKPIDKYHKTFEYAGAGEIWNLDAAKIPVYYVDNYWIIGSRPGTRIDSWFQNRLGSSFGNVNRSKTHVKGDVGVQFDVYDAGTYAADGMLELSDNWKCEQVGEYSKGKPMFKITQS